MENISQTAKKQILIVEDDASLCWLLKMILGETYEVEALNNPIDAWCWLTEGNTPHLIITDIMLPVIDGIELVEDIRTSGLFRSVPIIILSGYNDPELKRKCDAWGVNAFLTKPFRPQLLLETAKEALEQQKVKTHA